MKKSRLSWWRVLKESQLEWYLSRAKEALSRESLKDEAELEEFKKKLEGQREVEVKQQQNCCKRVKAKVGPCHLHSLRASRASVAKAQVEKNY